jgi:NAD(P) transhydrogenase subunit beta
LNAYKARTVMIIKRGMSAGFAGIDNELYYSPNTLMLFGDARVFVSSLVKEVAATTKA